MTIRLPGFDTLPKRFSGWKRQIRFIQNQYKSYVENDLTLTRLLRPQRFSEKMQWRKLFDASPLFKQFSDRIAVQHFIRSKGFDDMLVPQLWVGSDPRAIPFDILTRPFVLKTTHASGQVIIMHPDREYDQEQIIQQASAWLDVCYGTMQSERGYIGVPRQLVVEPLLTCRDGSPPMEFKIFVFNGVARIFQYNAIDRDRNYKIGYLNRNWEIYPWKTSLSTVPDKPGGYDLAVKAAERLCQDVDHCRVDFYFVDDKIYIGELTPYSWSGMVTLDPPHVDIVMGSFWKIRNPTIRALFVMAFSDWGGN